MTFSKTLLDPAATAEIGRAISFPLASVEVVVGAFGDAMILTPASRAAVRVAFRNLYRGTVADEECEVGAEDGVVARLSAEAEECFPAHIAVVPPAKAGRGWTYMLPEPESVFSATSPRRGVMPGAQGNAGPVFVERRDGVFYLYADATDWQDDRPFAVTRPEMGLGEVVGIARARLHVRSEAANEMAAGRDPAGTHALTLESSPVAELLRQDPMWFARMADGRRADRVARATSLLDALGDPELGLRALDGMEAFSAGEDAQGVAIAHADCKVFFALADAEIMSGMARSRFEGAWQTGGFGGRLPAVELALATPHGRRMFPAIEPIVSCVWAFDAGNPPDADLSAFHTFGALLRNRPDAAQPVRVALIEHGYDAGAVDLALLIASGEL